jgi:hypothetical protein
VRLRQEGDEWYVDAGKYALYLHVRDGGKWRVYKKTASVRVSGPDVLVESETHLCRRSVLKPGR